MIPGAGEDLEQVELSYTAGENVKSGAIALENSWADS